MLTIANGAKADDDNDDDGDDPSGAVDAGGKTEANAMHVLPGSPAGVVLSPALLAANSSWWWCEVSISMRCCTDMANAGGSADGLRVNLIDGGSAVSRSTRGGTGGWAVLDEDEDDLTSASGTNEVETEAAGPAVWWGPVEAGAVEVAVGGCGRVVPITFSRASISTTSLWDIVLNMPSRAQNTVLRRSSVFSFLALGT